MLVEVEVLVIDSAYGMVSFPSKKKLLDIEYGWHL
jgi:hypothetical protein